MQKIKFDKIKAMGMDSKIEDCSDEILKRLFTEAEAAKYLSMSRSYLRQDRMNGKIGNRTPGPNFCRFGGMIRYTKEDLDHWIEYNQVVREGHA